jgi:hypothetical protein
LTTYGLAPSLLTNNQTFYAPTVASNDQTLTSSLFTNNQTFFSATVTSNYTLIADIIDFNDKVTNGRFNSNDISAWSAVSGNPATAQVVSGQMEVTKTSTSVGAMAYIATTVVGRQYRVQGNGYAGTAGVAWRFQVGPSSATSNYFSGTDGQDVDVTFIATSTTTYIRCRVTGATAGLTCFFDNISCVEQPALSATVSSVNSLATTLVSNSQTFYGATVIRDQGLTPSLFANNQTFYSAVVTPGTVNLTPSLFTNSQTFYVETVSSVYPLTPTKYTNNQVFYSEIVTSGAVTLTPSLFTNNQTFFAPTVTGGGTIAPDLFTNTVTFYGVTVTPGAINLTPSLVTNTSTLYAPSAVNDNTLVPPLLSSGNVIYLPTAVAGLVTLSPSLFENVSIFSTFDIVSPPKWRTSTNIEFIVGRRLPPKRRHLTFNNRR